MISAWILYRSWDCIDWPRSREVVTASYNEWRKTCLTRRSHSSSEARLSASSQQPHLTISSNSYTSPSRSSRMSNLHFALPLSIVICRQKNGTKDRDRLIVKLSWKLEDSFTESYQSRSLSLSISIKCTQSETSVVCSYAENKIAF